MTFRISSIRSSHLQGSLSNRAVGGAATDLLFKKVRAGDTARDLHGYIDPASQRPHSEIEHDVSER